MLQLAKTIQKNTPNAIVCASTIDIHSIIKNTKLSVYAQHTDPIQKRGTGFVDAAAIKQSGACGTLLNHSEHPLDFDILKETINQCKKLGLKTIVCAESLSEVKRISKLLPTAIAFEEPKLIGTKESIVNSRPRLIKRFVKLLEGKKIMSLCGAGIHNVQDVMQAYRLGCKGVLIASAIANSNKPEPLLKSLHPFSVEPKIIVFVDRDGTLIYDNKYHLGHARDWRKKIKYLPGVVEGLSLLNRTPGVQVYMVTNQPGVAIKEFSCLTEKRAHEVCQTMLLQLQEKGAFIKDYALCPHPTSEYVKSHTRFKFKHDMISNTCMKPKPKLLIELLKREKLTDPKLKLYMVGDRFSDIKAALNVCGKGILVPFQNKKKEIEAVPRNFKHTVHITKNFLDAARIILKHEHGN